MYNHNVKLYITAEKDLKNLTPGTSLNNAYKKSELDVDFFGHDL